MKKIILMLLLSTSLCAEKHEFYVNRSIIAHSYDVQYKVEELKKNKNYINIEVEKIFDKVKVECKITEDFFINYDELVIVDY